MEGDDGPMPEAVPSRRSPGPIVVAAAVSTPLAFGVSSIGMVLTVYDWMMYRSSDGGSLAVMVLTGLLAGVPVGLVARLRGWALVTVPVVGIGVSVVFAMVVRAGSVPWVGLVWLVALAVAVFSAAWLPSRVSPADAASPSEET
jgi:hypothetical protein